MKKIILVIFLFTFALAEVQDGIYKYAKYTDPIYYGWTTEQWVACPELSGRETRKRFFMLLQKSVEDSTTDIWYDLDKYPQTQFNPRLLSDLEQRVKMGSRIDDAPFRYVVQTDTVSIDSGKTKMQAVTYTLYTGNDPLKHCIALGVKTYGVSFYIVRGANGISKDEAWDHPGLQDTVCVSQLYGKPPICSARSQAHLINQTLLPLSEVKK
ncbi:hypothetical protein R83H12_01657 [Fibrobacteria bacterium R8-3-H12]